MHEAMQVHAQNDTCIHNNYKYEHAQTWNNMHGLVYVMHDSVMFDHVCPSNIMGSSVCHD